MKNDDLLMQIMMLDFAVQDSALFIDTHPCDKEAMNYFNEAATRLKAAKKNIKTRSCFSKSRSWSLPKRLLICTLAMGR